MGGENIMERVPPQSATLMHNRKFVQAVFIASLCLVMYWLIGLYAVKSVYEFVLVGVLYEILWMPMLVLLAVLPVLSVMQIAKGTKSSRKIALSSLLLSLAAVLFLIF